MNRASQDHRVLAVGTVLGPDILLVERITGNESLGRPFEYVVVVVSEEESFSFDNLLGTPATVRLELNTTEGEGTRFFNGVVNQVAHTGYDHHGNSRYELTLVPWLWFLTRSANCRIFQELTVPEILEKLFEGYRSANFVLSLQGRYPKRGYCVQYRESDFNFVQRLMEHEGIYYYWTHEDGNHTMVICDTMSAHKAVAGYDEIIYRSNGSGAQKEDYLSSWKIRQFVTPGVYSVNSFDFESPQPSPNSRLLSKDDKPHQHGEGEHEIYDYPADFVDREEGERLAGIRREEAQCETRTVIAQTNARGLICGAEFTPKEVPREDQCNKKHVVISVSFQASAGNFGSGTGGGEQTYSCSFSAIPKEECVFRPARSARIPRMQGLQTAMVTGPAGEEIFVDEYGRVKVQFHWDREGQYDDGTSCWIRVAQVWAGGAWGAMAIPRIGQEVIVDFLEGDPDQPIITGRVYNGDARVPYQLPQEKTKTTIKTKSTPDGGKGHNELRFEDKTDSEQIYMHGQKDLDVRIRNDIKETNYGHRHERIGWKSDEGSGGSHFVTVREDENTHIEKKHFEMIDEDSHTTVKGEVSENHEKSHKTHVGQDHVIKATNSITETSQAVSVKTGQLKLQGATGAYMLGQMIVLEGTSICLKSGSNFVAVNPGGVQIKGASVLINSGGAASSAQKPDSAPEIKAEQPFDAKVAVDSVGGEKRRYSSGPPPTRGSGPAEQIEAPPYEPPKDGFSPQGSKSPGAAGTTGPGMAHGKETSTVCGCLFSFMDGQSRKPNSGNTLEVKPKSAFGDEVITFKVKEKCHKGGVLKYSARCDGKVLAEKVLHSKPLTLQRWTYASAPDAYGTIRELPKASPKVIDLTFTCSCEEHEVGKATIRHYPADKAELSIDSGKWLDPQTPVGSVVDRVAKYLTKMTGKRFSPKEGFTFSNALGHLTWDVPQIKVAYTGTWDEYENGHAEAWKCYYLWELDAGLNPLVKASVKGDLIAIGGTSTGVGAPVVQLYGQVRKYVNGDKPLIYFEISFSTSISAFVSSQNDTLTGGGKGAVVGAVEVGAEINNSVIEAGLAAASDVSGEVKIFGQDSVAKFQAELVKWGGVKGKAKLKIKAGRFFSIGYEKEAQLIEGSGPLFNFDGDLF